MKKLLLALASLFPIFAFAQTPDELCRQAEELISRHQFLQALDRYEKAGNGIKALKGQGEVFLKLYDTPKAQDAFIKAYKKADQTKGNTAEKAELLTLIADTWYQFNDISKCIDYLKQAKTIYDAIGLDKNPLGCGRTYELYGKCCLVSKETADDALRSFANARKLYIKAKGERCIEELKISLLEAEAYKMLGQHGNAYSKILYLVESGAHRDISDDQFLHALQMGIELNVLDGDRQAAMNLTTSLKELIPKYPTINTSLLRNLYATMGNSYIIEGSFREAWPELKKAFEIQRQIAKSHLTYLTEEERQLMWEADYRVLNSVFALNRTAFPGDSICSLLYDTSLLIKGLLLNASTNVMRAIENSGDRQLQEDFNKLRLMQREGLIASETAMNGQAKPEDRIASEKIAKLQESIRQKIKGMKGIMAYTDLTWKDVRNSLKADEVAVEFIVSTIGQEEKYSALVLRNNFEAPKIVNVNPEDGYSMWRGIAKYLRPNDRVYFSPAGLFNCLGIEYQDMGGGKSLCDIYDMRRVTSTRALVNRRATSNSQKTATLFYNLEYGRVLEKNRARVNFYWHALESTEDEGDIIKEALEGGGFRVDSKTELDGTERRLYELSGKSPKVLHLATHGFYMPEINTDPLHQCGLVMSSGNESLPYIPQSTPDDNVATAAEIATLDLRNTDLIVLSACRTALGEIKPDGVFGLQRAFKQSGAGVIIMTLETVSDDLSCELMQHFYTNLVQGMPPTKALREAQKAVAKEDKDGVRKLFVMLDDVE